MKLNKILLLSLLLTSCTDNPSSTIASSPIKKDDDLILTSEEVGKQITSITTEASSMMYDVKNITNDSGMSGSESYLHTHTNTFSRNTMFMTKANQEENYVILTLPNTFSLGHLYIWNLNDKAKTDSGVKEFEILTSLDGKDYKKVTKDRRLLNALPIRYSNASFPL